MSYHGVRAALGALGQEATVLPLNNEAELFRVNVDKAARALLSLRAYGLSVWAKGEALETAPWPLGDDDQGARLKHLSDQLVKFATVGGPAALERAVATGDGQRLAELQTAIKNVLSIASSETLDLSDILMESPLVQFMQIAVWGSMKDLGAATRKAATESVKSLETVREVSKSPLPWLALLAVVGAGGFLYYKMTLGRVL